MTVVIDASALLAFLQAESGADRVATLLGDSIMSTVNWSEVVQKSLARNISVSGLSSELAGAGVEIVPLTQRQAELAGGLWTRTRDAGLSLADRCCLALGLERAARVVTADRAWTRLDLAIDVECIR